MAKITENKVIDYISGLEVKATPEEVEAVQIFARQLVEDYGYDKSQIQTHPQFRVKVRPSDVKKEYPVDIAVFPDATQNEDEVYIIVECKKKNRKDGKTQLENYLTLSKAYLGVWFNGDERFFLQKFVQPDGKILFAEIPNIPKKGQRVEDIGQFKRVDLKPTHNLKGIFRSIRSFLAANNIGATRDEILAQQLINIIFCKLYDEKFTTPDDMVRFRAGINETQEEVAKRILDLFEEVRTNLPEVIDERDKITLDTKSLVYVVGELQNYSLMESERDVVADAFETFIGHALKGGQGQFFTPRNVVKMLVEILAPTENEKIIDPACGSGGFLIETLKYVWEKIEQKGKKLKWSPQIIEKEQIKVATNNFRGIDKDYFLSKVAKAYMNLVGDGTTGIFCQDSLDLPENWANETQARVKLGEFDVILTNPPFGKEIKVVGEKKLNQYTLSYEWKKNPKGFFKTNKLRKEIQPQFLFIERCFHLLKDGGRLGIILPETFFHAPKMHYIIQLFKSHNIMSLVDLPHNTFRPHNNAKCIALIIQKNKPQQSHIKMAVAVQMGHDHNGKPMYRWDYQTQTLNKGELWDDIPLILKELQNPQTPAQYTFDVDATIASQQNVYVPRYYWNTREQEIERVAKEQKLDLISIQDLIDQKVLKAFDGHGSPSADNKGMGDVPYIRVKDIVNWEVYKDPTALIPQHVFEAMRPSNKALQAEDLLFVRRGSYRIGSVALVSPHDTEVLLTREILVLRVNPKNTLGLTPYYLIYLLSHYLVQMQMYNKILMETTLPNIANRWSELRLPIHQEEAKRKSISDKIQSIFQKKWEAQKEILDIEAELGSNLTT